MIFCLLFEKGRKISVVENLRPAQHKRFVHRNVAIGVINAGNGASNVDVRHQRLSVYVVHGIEATGTVPTIGNAGRISACNEFLQFGNDDVSAEFIGRRCAFVNVGS